MKIAIIGIRGVPVVYSGFESFAETLSTSLSHKYSFYVYCRKQYMKAKMKDFHGVNLITLPSPSSKNFESIVHGLLSTLHACLVLKPRIIYFLGVGNAPFVLIANLFRIKTVINVDGLDWKREKWSFIARKYLQYSELIASQFAQSVITDSLYIKKYYEQTYGRKTIYIPYMFDPKLANQNMSQTILKKKHLNESGYIVWVGRLVPDNHLDDLIDALNVSQFKYKCVIIGDDLYKSQYKVGILKKIRSNKRIIHTGFLSRTDCASLVQHAMAYIETKRSGGTHPSLIEAAYLCNQIICLDLKSHRDILKKLGVSAHYYDNSKENSSLTRLLLNIKSISTKPKTNNYLEGNKITKKYEKIFSNNVG